MKVIRLKHLLKGNFGGVWGDDLDCNENSYTYILRSTEQNENGNWVINWESVARRNLLRVTNFHTLKKNDIVITKSSGSAGHIGKATLVDENIEKLHCSFSNFMQCLQLDAGKCNPRFYWYYLNSRHCKEQYKISCTTSTGLLNLNSDTFNNLNVPFFSVEYQNQCVAFLDKTISKIEDAIEKHKIQLDFLSSYRQSLITRAVTKGLDGDHQTSFIPLKYLAKLNPDVEQAMSDEIEYLPMEKVKNGMFLHHSDKLANLPPSLNSFEDGDILLAKVTPCFENGNICLAENCKGGVGRCSTELFVLRPNPQKVMPKFLMLLLQTQSFKQEAACQMRGTGGLKRIPADWLCNYKFPIPSLEKQKQIVEYMASKHSNLDGLTKIIKDSICLLNDYRSSLISAAVTGQLAIEEAEE